MPNYTKELVACFLAEKTNRDRRKSPKKRKMKTKFFTMVLPDKSTCYNTFLQEHAIDPETGRAYLGFCESDFDCDRSRQPRLTLANDSNSDQELARFHTIKNFVHVVVDDDDRTTWKFLRANLSKNTNMIRFKSVVNKAVKNRFDVGHGFVDKWDLVQYQIQLLAYEQVFGKGESQQQSL